MIFDEVQAALSSAPAVLRRGLDYSTGTIPGATIKAAGYAFVIRYVDAPANIGRKHVTPGEYLGLTRAGVDVYLVFEINTNDMGGGYAQGVAYARRAMAGAAWLGYPNGLPIFAAVDEVLAGAQVPLAISYLNGFVDTLYHDGRWAWGAYGFSAFTLAAVKAHKEISIWQCGSASVLWPGVHVWQRNDRSVQVGGVTCDVNEQYVALPTARPLPTPPTPTPAPVQEDTLPSVDDVWNHATPDPTSGGQPTVSATVALGKAMALAGQSLVAAQAANTAATLANATAARAEATVEQVLVELRTLRAALGK